MAKRKSKFDKLAKSFADALTAEQIIVLYQIVDPLTDQEREEFAQLSDDELARLLTA